jgi:hypothetical protein
MQPPSIRQRSGLLLVLATTFAALFAGLMLASPAGAVPPPPDSKIARAGDSYVKAQCRFTTTSANYTLGTVRGRLTTSVGPNGYTGYKNLAEVHVQCFLYSKDTFGEVAQISNVDGTKAAYASQLKTVPVATGYFVCVQAQYRRTDGIPENISTVCA